MYTLYIPFLYIPYFIYSFVLAFHNIKFFKFCYVMINNFHVVNISYLRYPEVIFNNRSTSAPWI